MDIFEFELRYLAYVWLNDRYNLDLKESDILDLVKRTAKWINKKKLIETTPEEIKKLTIETYTNHKKFFIKKWTEKKIWNYFLSDYVERLEYELKVIKEMWFNTYFLIVQDYVNWWKNNWVSVWPWRWSWAGSLLAYCTYITDIDPLYYDLLFERFLNPARISMPDFDIDFDDVKREKVIEYIKKKYWENKVASIWTYMTMAAKASFKDVARTFGMEFDKSNKISNLITEKTIAKSLEENEEFKEMVESDNTLEKIVNLAIKIEWTIRQTWIHACWIIISPDNLDELVPIQYPPKSWTKHDKDIEKVVTQYDWHYLEDIGLLKMDFLWLRNLSIIWNTIKIITSKYKNEWKEIPEIFANFQNRREFHPFLEDKDTFVDIFAKWNTSWIFQFESDWMKSWLRKLAPNSINDIIAMVALYRPWPMEFIPSYIDRKHWKEKISYMPNDLYSTLKNKYWEETANIQRDNLKNDLKWFMDITYGIAIYQEQLMRIVQSIAWFSLWEADLLRRWVWKKKIEIIEQLKKEFIDKWFSNKWYKEEVCKYVYEAMIEPAANYSFNKSHAVCYAYIAYQTAYLKKHFPIEFSAALLRSVEEDTDKLSKFINELKLQWFNVLLPNINESFTHVWAINENVRIWFLAIKWLWYEIAKTIETERKQNWIFKDLEDFLKRCSSVINKKSIESLAKSWALDIFMDRKTILANVSQILEWTKNSSNQSQGMWLFDVWDLWIKLEFQEILETTGPEKLIYEYEIFKSFISSHPLDNIYTYVKKKYSCFVSMIKDVEDYGDFKIFGMIKDIRRAMKKWFFVTIEDITWEMDIFFSDMMDIKKFDIFVFVWYKWKRAKIIEAYKIDIEKLKQDLKEKWKLNEEETVISIRWSRYWLDKENKEEKEEEKDELFQEDLDDTNQNNIIQKDSQKQKNEENKSIIEPIKKIEKDLKTNFEIPEDIIKIKEIIKIIKNNPWDIDISVWDIKAKVNQKWLERINSLF